MSVIEKEEKATSVVTQDETAWALIQRQCVPFLRSNFLPQSIKTLEQAITIAWKGRELGIPPLYALNSISIVNGKPTLSAELMLALIYKSHPAAQVNFTTPVDKQALECEATFQRPGGKPQAFRFTLEDAKRANLVNKTVWQQYPAAMLRSRVIAMGARAVFPDALMGMVYTDEEMESVQDATSSAPIEVEVKRLTEAKEINPEPAQPPKTEFIPPTKKPGYTGPLSEAQKKRMYAIGKANGWLPEEIKVLVASKFNKSHFIDLTRDEYDVICATLENKNLNQAPEMPDNYSAEAPH